jgi:predicted ribosome quality control (RQC) complex YloA/Tae2 family protein
LPEEYRIGSSATIAPRRGTGCRPVQLTLLRRRHHLREAVREMNVEHPKERGRSARLVIYALPGGWRVLVGRTEADNDRLSLKLARPGDWWFHVRGMPGSHVVLQGPDGEEPDRKTRESAAANAAHHSKARGGGVVAVTCTRARYVTKPPGAKPGTVQVRKEVVLKVRPAPGEIAAESEGDAG